MTETITVQLQPDPEGYLGRECPECERYFKITPGTGIKEPAPCHCPYCGHQADSSHFSTRDQIEYARSVAMRKIQGDIHQMLKRFEGPIGPQTGLIRMSMTVKPGAPLPLRMYQELGLETHVICDNCTLRYAIYGVFAFCPDCGNHNSLQILNKNLDICAKELELAAQAEQVLAEHLIGDALENAVSAFDGFGREIFRLSSITPKNVTGNQQMTFQNLEGARNKLKGVWKLDLSSGADASEWEFACRCFQKRHLIAHKMGVVDEAYIRATGDMGSVVGRKICVAPQEVESLTHILRKLGAFLFASLPGLPKGQQP